MHIEDHSPVIVLLQFLGTLGLFAFGVRTVRHILQARAEKFFDWSLELSELSPGFMAPLMGVVMASVFQAPGSLGLMLVGLVNAGLYPLKAARGVAIGLPWSSMILALLLTLPFGEHALILSGPAALCWLIAEDRALGNWGKALLGISFFYLSVNLGQPLITVLVNSLNLVNPSSLSLCLGLGIFAFVLSFFIRTQIYSPFLAIMLTSTGMEWILPSWSLVLGASLGVSAAVVYSARATKVTAQRIALGMLIPQFIFTLILIPLLAGMGHWLMNAFPHQPEFVLTMGWGIFALCSLIFSSAGDLLWSKLIEKSVPDSKLKQPNHLAVIGKNSSLMPSTTLVQAEMANDKFSDIVSRMFSLTREYLHQDAKWPRMLAKIKKYERITDNLQKENTNFLCALTQKELTQKQSVRVQVALRIADELESVADYLDKLATGYTHLTREGGLQVHERHALFDLFDKVHSFYIKVIEVMNDDGPLPDDAWSNESEALRIRSENLRSDTVERAKRGEMNPARSLAYSDMIVAMRKIRSHTHNIAQAMERLQED